MNKDELIDILGTIAKSGSKIFRQQTKTPSAEAIIGQ
jgi:HSP90 family molecular chaperone